MSASAGRFVWFELMTRDVPAAAAFYERVVGWTAVDAGMGGDLPYTLFKIGQAQVAGLMGTPPELAAIGRPPSWSGYVGVDDVDAMAARLLAAGGKVLKPAQDIPEVGRFAVVADPQGAAFMLFKARGGDVAPAVEPPTPGTIGWHELHAQDGAAATAFYTTLFGWTLGEGLDMGGMGIYQLFEIAGRGAGGIMTKMPHEPAPYWLHYFCVGGIESAAERVKTHGGQVVHGPVEVPGGAWIVNAVDPQGAAFALVGTPGA